MTTPSERDQLERDALVAADQQRMQRAEQRMQEAEQRMQETEQQVRATSEAAEAAKAAAQASRDTARWTFWIAVAMLIGVVVDIIFQLTGQ